MSTMTAKTSRKTKRRAADEMRDAVKKIAEERKAAGPPTALEVGQSYAGSDGHTYELIAVLDQTVTAKRDGKKIPFPRAMFTELVGLGNPAATAAHAEKAAKLKAAREAEKAAKAKAAEEATEKAKAASAAAKEARKALPSRGDRAVSGMWVIRTTLAKNLDATVEEISKACDKAGVPKSASTIATIMSDFKQTYAALLDAGRVVKG